MKNYTFLLLSAIILFIGGCSKDKPAQPATGTLHTVKINITSADFSQQLISSNNSRIKTDAVISDPGLLKNYIDTLYVNFAGKEFHFGKKTFSSMIITNKFSSGSSVYVKGIAGKSNLTVEDNGAYYGLYGGLPWSDCFAGQQTFTVGNSDITVNFQLNRIVADLKVIIQDKLPTNLDHITLAFSKSYWRYNLITMQTDTATDPLLNKRSYDYAVADTSVGKPNFMIDFLTINTIAPFTLTISAYDKSKNLIASKVITNIKLTTNQKTILTGTLFGGTTNSNPGYNASADTTWGATTVKSF